MIYMFVNTVSVAIDPVLLLNVCQSKVGQFLFECFGLYVVPIFLPPVAIFPTPTFRYLFYHTLVIH
jgi:hypothetical protein